MSRRAAGRAGGRPWDRAPLLGTVLLGTVLLGAVPATLPVTPAQAAPADDRPVQITVDRLEPRTVTPGAPVELTVTLVNDSQDTLGDLTVRLQRGDVLTSRKALADDLAHPSEAMTATAPFQPVPGDLAPGKSTTFTYTTTADVLQLTGDGVYPLLVNLNGTGADGEPERVGELSTHLVVQPAAPAERTTVSWLWPFTDRPHRDATGAFTDDELAEEVADGGRLDRVVDVLEQLPRVPAAEPGQSHPAVPVTLAVDPALLEELSTMAAGPYPVGDEDGAGTTGAADLLERLRRLAGEHPVVALPYADVDVDALVAAGESAAVTRTLPGAAEGTARQPGATGGDSTPADTTPAGSPTPTGDGAATGSGQDGDADPADGDGAGAAIVRDVLGTAPRTDLAWPADGAVSGPGLDTLQAGGAGTVVLSDRGLTEGGRAVGADGGPAVSHGTLPTAGGDVEALVADTRLTDVVAGATPGSGAGRLIEQAYLAELGAITSQGARDAGAPQSVLVAPPRRVDPDPATVAAMMADTFTQPWLAPGSAAALEDAPETDVGQLTGAATDTLPADGLARITESSRVRDDFAGAVVGDPGTVLAGYDAAIARAGSAQWRGDPDGSAAAATDLRRAFADLRDRVTLLAPVDGTYSLASSDAPLVLTVQNDLPFAVDVRLDLRTRGKVGLDVDDMGAITLEPSSRTPLQVPTHVRQSGGFGVTARLTTPAGGPLGEAVQMQVKSTAYGSITLGITIGAAALLGLLFLRRAVRFVLDRRRGEPTEPVPDGVGSVPPTRSPV